MRGKRVNSQREEYYEGGEESIIPPYNLPHFSTLEFTSSPSLYFLPPSPLTCERNRWSPDQKRRMSGTENSTMAKRSRPRPNAHALHRRKKVGNHVSAGRTAPNAHALHRMECVDTHTSEGGSSALITAHMPALEKPTAPLTCTAHVL